MKRKLAVLGVVSLLAAGWLAGTLPAQALPVAVYQVVQQNVGPAQAGGSGAYQVSSSVGQPDAGEVSAGSYTLGGGFWGGGVIGTTVEVELKLYLPLTQR
jgi:hypothetical protein